MEKFREYTATGGKIIMLSPRKHVAYIISVNGFIEIGLDYNAEIGKCAHVEYNGRNTVYATYLFHLHYLNELLWESKAEIAALDGEEDLRLRARIVVIKRYLNECITQLERLIEQKERD